jgi:hypothetical protein
MKIFATSQNKDEFDIGALLHPGGAFGRPIDVVNGVDLTLDEKRAILASWASDVCAVEAAPALRRAPGAHRPVSIDEILDALRSLDAKAHEVRAATERRRRLDRRKRLETWRTTRSRLGPRPEAPSRP